MSSTRHVPKEYDPNRLLNTILERMHLQHDAALAKRLKVAPQLLVRMREHGVPVSGSLLMRMHEVTQIPIAELRQLMGDRRRRYRVAVMRRGPAA